MQSPARALLDLDSLPEGFRVLGEGLQYFAQCIAETRTLAKELAKGDLHGKLPSANNEIAAPLKALHSTLKHLTWQTQQVAKGDYHQRVEFMGDFAEAFNAMVEQLEQRYAALREAKDEAESASKSKSAFLATMSHEIRTPLNAIIGLSEIQLQKPPSKETLSELEKIHRSGTALLGIINNILDISKIETGSFELVPVSYDLLKLINDAVQLNIVYIGAKAVEFDLQIDGSLPSRLCGDELRVRQILNNLLSNAFKYTREGSVTLRAGWERTAGGAELSFAVSDTGIGIKKEDLKKLFSEYSQLDTRANRSIEGTGLGLSIAKKLAALMGGTITVESEYGAGSTFRVFLPQRIEDETPIGEITLKDLENLRPAEKPGTESVSRAYMPYGRVLVVDDVPTNLDVAKGLMAPYGLTVDCVMDAWEAVERIRAIGDGAGQKYDAVFMDHMMPGMDGIEATRILRGEIGTDYARTVPVIALTANALSGNEEMFLSKGFNDFLSKPISVARLDELLNKWVRGRQSEETLRAAEEEAARRASVRDFSAASFPEDTSVEGIDLKAGMRIYESGENYLRVLRSYALHTPALLDRLILLFPENLAEYAIVVHGLKGASDGICADETARLAEALENAAKKADLAAVRANHETFVEMARALVAGLEKFLSRSAADGVPKKRLSAPENALLLKMLEAARHFSTSQMEAVMEELESCDYESGKDLIIWLRVQMDNLEYGAIQERLDAWTGSKSQ